MTVDPLSIWTKKVVQILKFHVVFYNFGQVVRYNDIIKLETPYGIAWTRLGELHDQVAQVLKCMAT